MSEEKPVLSDLETRYLGYLGFLKEPSDRNFTIMIGAKDPDEIKASFDNARKYPDGFDDSFSPSEMDLRVSAFLMISCGKLDRNSPRLFGCSEEERDAAITRLMELGFVGYRGPVH